MLNLYPFVETNPNKLPQEINKEIYSKNIEEIKKIISEYEDSDILCAWGVSIEKRKYLKSSLIDILKEIKCKKLKKLDLTTKGHPRHPLYCKIPAELDDFDIKEYKYIK